MSKTGSHKSDEDWRESLDRALGLYPAMAGRDWVQEFTSNLDMMGRIIGDVLKLQKAEDNPHRRGRRTVPQISREELWLLFEGFSTENFTVALERLLSGKSIRQGAIKCKMNHMALYRLYRGELTPSLEIMEQIAEAFNKSPYYFTEYRAEMICLLVKKSLLDNPNRSITLFRNTLGRPSKGMGKDGHS